MVLVGEWLGKRGGPLGCPLCSSSTTSWSVAAWIDHSIDRWTDVVNADSLCYVCTRGKIVKIRFERGLQSASPRFLEIWMLIASFTLWYIWKARCLKVFQDMVQPPRGSDHGHMVRAYQLPTRAIGRGLQPLQRRHCPFALLAEMAEHTYGDARRKWPEVELPAPTLIVSCSPATLSSL